MFYYFKYKIILFLFIGAGTQALIACCSTAHPLQFLRTAWFPLSQMAQKDKPGLICAVWLTLSNHASSRSVVTVVHSVIWKVVNLSVFTAPCSHPSICLCPGFE